jgi:hypothetical protein
MAVNMDLTAIAIILLIDIVKSSGIMLVGFALEVERTEGQAARKNVVAAAAEQGIGHGCT